MPLVILPDTHPKFRHLYRELLVKLQDVFRFTVLNLSVSFVNMFLNVGTLNRKIDNKKKKPLYCHVSSEMLNTNSYECFDQ